MNGVGGDGAGDDGARELKRVPGSFRDPAGQLFEHDGVLLRTVTPGFAEQYDRFIDSGLYERLTDEGLLVRHEEVDPALTPLAEPVHRVLRPARVPFVSHPYEWSPAQLREAALLTLRVQQIALEHGMVLRDASAYNVQFLGTDPVFIDTLSFGTYAEGRPWTAYGQFCRHFLAPLALQVKRDVRLGQLLRANLDGVPLDLASGLLRWRTWLSPGLLMHLHLHARALRSRPVDPDERVRSAHVSRRALIGIVDQLRRACDKLVWAGWQTTIWSDYYEHAAHYSSDAMTAKRDVIVRWLDAIAPSSVWDLGANTGRFSRLAADRGAQVVAFDVDPGAAEGAYRDLRSDPPLSGSVLPLVLDLTNPSPGIGWANEERASVVGRGPADVVLALALVHHLAIGNNVPLPKVVDFLLSLGRRVVIEFAPKSDPKVQVLLATREDVFSSYTAAQFETVVRERARLVERVPVVDSERVLFLLERS